MADEPSAVETFGVRVGDVLALAPNVSLGTDPDTDDTATDLYRPADRVITNADVEKWIASVAARVDVRLVRRAALTTPAYVSALTSAAADAVANGAAAYLVGAAAPTRASLNDPGAYDGVLWARFESALTDAAAALDAWLAPAADGGTGAGATPPSGRAGWAGPKPLFPDGLRF